MKLNIDLEEKIIQNQTNNSDVFPECFVFTRILGVITSFCLNTYSKL